MRSGNKNKSRKKVRIVLVETAFAAIELDGFFEFDFDDADHGVHGRDRYIHE